MINAPTSGEPAGVTGTVDLVDAVAVEVARDGMRRLSAGARRWLGGTVRYLAPDFPDLPVTPKAKACLELALLRRLWSRVRPDDEHLVPVAATVDAIWHDPEFPTMIAAAPDYFRPYALVYAALAPPGAILHPPTLERLAPQGRLGRYGRSPYLRLEARYYADLAGLDHDLESYRVLYQGNLLANLTDVTTDVEEAYRVTHTLFHVTDFGAYPADLTEAERRRALDIVDRMTDHFVAVEYWDLVAELMFSQHCLGQDPTRSRSGAAGIRALLAVQTVDGRIPARFAAQRPPETSAPVDLFRYAYHTTLVTALTAMISLGRD